jgi:hypothetical protein
MRNDYVISSARGAVKGQDVVSLSASRAEMAELRAALKILAKYEKRAFKVAGYDPGNADWTMVNQNFRRGCVVMTIDHGACG